MSDRCLLYTKYLGYLALLICFDTCAWGAAAFEVEVRKLGENSKGVYSSELLLKNRGKILAKHVHTSDPTGGYLSEVAIDKKNSRFVAISIDAGEFCNGLVFFDLKKHQVANHMGCVSDSHICRVTHMSTSGQCIAKIFCRDEGAEGKPASKADINKSINLCE